jgi:hypothetical protein
LKFQLAFRYVLDRPGGFVNLLMMLVCLLIPFVGPIVLLGYRAEVAVALELDPAMRRHPKFTFERFVQYLTRGVWPFLIALILSLPIFLLYGALIVAFVINPPGPNNPPLLAFALFGGGYLLAISIQLFLTIPMMFHAKIIGRFDLAGAFRFAWAFWMLVGWLAVGTGIVYTFLALVIAVIGLLCCFVGIYPAAVLIEMASLHLMVQLYRIYLDRGGDPIPEYIPTKRDEDDDDDEDDESEDEPRSHQR